MRSSLRQRDGPLARSAAELEDCLALVVLQDPQLILGDGEGPPRGLAEAQHGRVPLLVVVALPVPHDPVLADVLFGRGHAAPRERNTSMAASRPGAPMIPPPGWVDEPHSQRFAMGVRNRPKPGTGRPQN